MLQKANPRLRNLASRKVKNAQKRMKYQQKHKQQEGDMRIYNLMWKSKELRNNRLTPLNKDNQKKESKKTRQFYTVFLIHEKDLKTYKNQQKNFSAIYHIIRNVCYWENWQFPFAIYFLILFLYMKSIIVSLITTNDKLNLLNYDKRQTIN